MTFPISPGVYPREIDKSHVVLSSANSIGAIVIHSHNGPANKVTLVTSNKEFIDLFGKPQPDQPSKYCALAFLEKAKRLYVVRAINDATTATRTVVDSVAATVFTINAANPGVWGNSLTVDVTAPVSGEFTITVYLSGTKVETFKVSKTATKLDGFGRSMYLEDVINGVSSYITVTDNVGVQTAHVALTNSALTGGANDTAAPSDAQINTAWDLFAVPENVEISLLINGGWTTTSVQTKMISIAESRKDCFAILDMPSAETTVSNMVTYVSSTLNANTSWAAIYTGWPYIYDQYWDKKMYIPPSGHVAGVYARTAEVSEVWYAPAGARRAVLNVLGVKNVFSEGDRDTLYAAKINPIQNFVGEGIQVHGQKTLQTAASALDRVNVRLLMISIMKSMTKALRPFIFEFNDQFTRDNISSILNSFLENVKTRRGVYEYLVVCDTTNNTPQVIDGNQLIVDVFVKPTRVAEFIQLNGIISATGAKFTAG